MTANPVRARVCVSTCPSLDNTASTMPPTSQPQAQLELRAPQDAHSYQHTLVSMAAVHVATLGMDMKRADAVVCVVISRSGRHPGCITQVAVFSSRCMVCYGGGVWTAGKVLPSVHSAEHSRLGCTLVYHTCTALLPRVRRVHLVEV